MVDRWNGKMGLENGERVDQKEKIVGQIHAVLNFRPIFGTEEAFSGGN